jgi:hypothetical protein
MSQVGVGPMLMPVAVNWLNTKSVRPNATVERRTITTPKMGAGEIWAVANFEMR